MAGFSGVYIKRTHRSLHTVEMAEETCVAEAFTASAHMDILMRVYSEQRSLNRKIPHG